MKRREFIRSLSLISAGVGAMNVNKLYQELKDWKNTPKMPLLFLGHGSPMNAVEDNEFVRGFRDIVKKVPTPRAVLCISAHWETRGTKVTAMEMPRTIHDFGGFPKELFEVRYPAKGSPELAKETAQLLIPVMVELDHSWGLDHGAWSVIKHLYPNAEIPVIQMSLDYTKGAQYHFDLAQKLSTLRSKGVLIVGSGNIVHNLRQINFAKPDGYNWAMEAREVINQHIMDRDFKSLFDYSNHKALQLAIPTPEHYWPLIYALGAMDAQKEDLQLFNDKLLMGSVSMTSIFAG